MIGLCQVGNLEEQRFREESESCFSDFRLLLLQTRIKSVRSQRSRVRLQPKPRNVSSLPHSFRSLPSRSACRTRSRCMRCMEDSYKLIDYKVLKGIPKTFAKSMIFANFCIFNHFAHRCQITTVHDYSKAKFSFFSQHRAGSKWRPRAHQHITATTTPEMLRD